MEYNSAADSLAKSAAATSERESRKDRGTELEQATKQQEKWSILLSELNENEWYKVVESVSIDGNGLQILLNSIGSYIDNTLKINYHSKVEPLLTNNVRTSIKQELCQYFAKTDLIIDFCAVEKSAETPRERRARLLELAIDQAEAKLHDDPQIKYLLENLNATLARGSIQLTNR